MLCNSSILNLCIMFRHLCNILMYVYIVIFLMQFSLFILLISIVINLLWWINEWMIYLGFAIYFYFLCLPKITRIILIPQNVNFASNHPTTVFKCISIGPNVESLPLRTLSPCLFLWNNKSQMAFPWICKHLW